MCLLKCFACFACWRKRAEEQTEEPVVVDGTSVWTVLSNRVSKRVSSWSLPSKENPKWEREQFEKKFDKYLALDKSDSSKHSEDSVSSTMSQLLA